MVESVESMERRDSRIGLLPKPPSQPGNGQPYPCARSCSEDFHRIDTLICAELFQSGRLIGLSDIKFVEGPSRSLLEQVPGWTARSHRRPVPGCIRRIALRIGGLPMIWAPAVAFAFAIGTYALVDDALTDANLAGWAVPVKLLSADRCL